MGFFYPLSVCTFIFTQKHCMGEACRSWDAEPRENRCTSIFEKSEVARGRQVFGPLFAVARGHSREWLPPLFRCDATLFVRCSNFALYEPAREKWAKSCVKTLKLFFLSVWCTQSVVRAVPQTRWRKWGYPRYRSLRRRIKKWWVLRSTWKG